MFNFVEHPQKKLLPVTKYAIAPINGHYPTASPFFYLWKLEQNKQHVMRQKLSYTVTYRSEDDIWKT